MEVEQQKPQQQTTVRIYKGTKERIQEVVRKMTGQGPRRVSEIEVADSIITQHLPKLERKFGIKSRSAQ